MQRDYKGASDGKIERSASETESFEPSIELREVQNEVV